MNKEAWWTIAIIILVIGLAYFILTKENPQTDSEIAKCIGKNSELYVQLGCHACKTQEDLFGENYQYLNVIDCFYEKEKCITLQITGTPTWIIKDKKLVGVQSFEKLKELTGC